jgi:hypothetical protein
MKTNVSDGLDKVLNIDSEYEVIEPKSVEVDENQEIDSDYKYARENLYGVIEKGTDALDTLIELAKASEHPRAFEVVSQLTKTLVDANKDLLDIQKKVKDLKKSEKEDQPKNVTNALFIGSTAELQKLVNGKPL